MKKTIDQYFCDECGEERDPKNLIHFISIVDAEICFNCLQQRVKISLKQFLLGQKCEKCRGNKTLNEFYGPHNDYEWKKCEKCNGTGLAIFSCSDKKEV